MLDPQGRRHLMEALHPPEGYELDRAVGTTYSLDLLALLTAPLAFTIFDWEDGDGRPGADPLALLETMRRYADRITVFCQAGQISIPKERQRLFGYLEDSVFEVSAHKPNGSFHPKVWALRFTTPEGPVLYRLLCMSRNLTFDRSWDTMLVLDGELTGRKNAFGSNNPLGDFFAALPGLAVHKVSERVRDSVDLIQHELRRVRFEIPEGFDSLAFHPLGIGGALKWPFKGRVDSMLVISPFVSNSMLGRLSSEANATVLISRLESLETLKPKHLEAFKRVCVLNAMADPEEGGEKEPLEDGATSLAGLHAKLYVADAGWEARVWTGSANATNAAFERNVEFLVELTGKKGRCGINNLLSQSGVETSFADLLQDYTPREYADGPDAEMERLAGLADGVRRKLATAVLRAQVNALPGEMERFEIRLRFRERSEPVLPSEVSGRCWPITLPATAVSIEADASADVLFSPLSFDALTSFFAFELTAASGDTEVARRFVLNAPLEGAPSNRRERIMRSLLDSQDKVLRLILFLLAEGGHDSQEALLATRRMLSGGTGGSGSVQTSFPLFEALVRALDRDPARLDQIARLLNDLQKTPEGQRLVPEGLETIWEPILSARGRIEV